MITVPQVNPHLQGLWQTTPLQWIGMQSDNSSQVINTLANNSDLLQTISGLWTVINIFSIISYILISWGLYQISKKLLVKYAWLSFIPILNFYNIIKCAWKSLWWILWIILIWILWMFIWWIVFWIITYLIMSWVIKIWILLSIIFLIIWYIIMYLLISIWYIIVLNAISKRTWRGGWTTLGFIFVPYIMYPVVWYKLKAKTSEESSEIEGKKDENEIKDKTVSESKIEEKVEL